MFDTEALSDEQEVICYVYFHKDDDLFWEARLLYHIYSQEYKIQRRWKVKLGKKVTTKNLHETGWERRNKDKLIAKIEQKIKNGYKPKIVAIKDKELRKQIGDITG